MKLSTALALLALVASATAQCSCPCACPSPPPSPSPPPPSPSPPPPSPSTSPSPGPSGLVEVTNTVGAFTYPADAWLDAPKGTGVSGGAMINCHGDPVHRFSTSLEDCKRFCTSLMTCFAVEFDADTGDCVPSLQYGWNDVKKGGNVFSSAWARVPEEMKIDVPAGCAQNATFFFL